MQVIRNRTRGPPCSVTGILTLHRNLPRKAAPDLAFGFDLEAAVRSANDTVSGTFNVMLGTIYVSMALRSYVFSVLFSMIQLSVRYLVLLFIALAYYAISYFPGGSAGMKFLSSALTSSLLKCFGR